MKRIVHGEMEHDSILQDIEDRGDEVFKHSTCKCGAKKTEEFWLMKELITQREDNKNAQSE